MPDDEEAGQDISGVVIEELEESGQSSARGGGVAQARMQDSQAVLLMRPEGASGSEGGLQMDSNAGGDDEEIGIVEQQEHFPGLMAKKKQKLFTGRVEPAGLGPEVPSKTRFAGLHRNFTEDQDLPTAMPTADLPMRTGSADDFEPSSTRNTTFLGGIFDTVKMKMSQTAFRKIMPKSDDEDDVHQFELQQLMDLPDGLLR
mgnify:CR=1 FL=1